MKRTKNGKAAERRPRSGLPTSEGNPKRNVLLEMVMASIRGWMGQGFTRMEAKAVVAQRMIMALEIVGVEWERRKRRALREVAAGRRRGSK